MSQSKLIERPLLTQQEINQLLGESTALSHALTVSKASTGRSGATQSLTPGAGMEFDDLRPYQLGDDPRQIDWRASARSQQTLVRNYLAELQQPLFILIDRGASMRFGSTQGLKVTQAVRVAIKLMGTFHQSGYEVGGLVLNPSAQWRPATANLEALRQFALDAAAPCPPIESQPHDWPRLFALLQEPIPTGSRLFLVSDFIDLDESALPQLGALAQRISMQAVRITDPLEQQLSALEGMELNWSDHTLNPQTVDQLTALQDTLKQQRIAVKERFSRAGVRLSELLSSNDSISDDWLRGLV